MDHSKCPRCLQVLSPDDTVAFETERIVHIDCARPRDLSPEERAILFRYCWAHAVARCVACAQDFRQQELGADFLGHRAHICPRCRADLTESLRGHLYRCGALPGELRDRTREAREAAAKLIKRSRELVDRTDVLKRESEAWLAADRGLMREARAALSALRETMRRAASPG